MTLLDYTHLSVGTEVGGATIEICPHCKRSGLRKILLEGVVTFYHCQELVVGATMDNLPLVTWDSCPRVKAH
jgi:hypothetical protein